MLSRYLLILNSWQCANYTVDFDYYAIRNYYISQFSAWLCLNSTVCFPQEWIFQFSREEFSKRQLSWSHHSQWHRTNRFFACSLQDTYLHISKLRLAEAQFTFCFPGDYLLKWRRFLSADNILDRHVLSSFLLVLQLLASGQPMVTLLTRPQTQ